MIRKGYLDLPDGQIHYRHLPGGDELPTVFLHQTASSGRMWERVMTEMAGFAPSYALDTPGFGGSFDPAIVPDIGDYARWIGDAIEALGFERVHLVGHHTGSAIAIELAVARPALAATLALIGPSPLTADERSGLAAKLGAAFRPTRSGAYLLKNWEYLRVGGADADIMVLHAELIDMLRAWSTRPHAYAAVWNQDALALLPRIACPVLMMAAPDDMLFPYLERALTACPNATAAALSAGANFEPDLAPAEVAAALRAHLAHHGSVRP